ncbi:MAG TPA: CAP domain-containing protein [Caldilineaceae bacterium]|nr:CAP domain-containing protein [Caldilineaceae bacterium]
MIQTGPRAPATDVGSSDGPVCTLNEKEAAVAALMATHPDQRRASLTCDPILASVARQRAEDMARRGYFDHVTPEGYGPNYLVKQAGYQLLSWYDQRPDANNLESIAAGYDMPDEAFAAWMDSEFHRIHLLGLNSFYADQVMYGIGYFYLEESPYGHYWVVLTAPKPE